MEERLRVAAKVGNINALYDLLEEDPEILERIHQKPFSDTLLHISASAGHTLFALEIMNLKPTLGRKLNARGLSSLDLALRNGHIGTVQRLICFHPQLVRVKGRGRITPLHYVAEVDEVDLLAEFLLSCPTSIEDLTITGETAVHIAVRNRRLSAFKVLLGLLQRTDHEDILNWKDEKGNTVLHIAASTNQTEIMTSQGGTTSRKSMSLTRKKSSAASESGGGPNDYSHRKSLTASRSMGPAGERTVKRLRLSKALTVPESTIILDACQRMATRRVDALLLTDSSALLCGILTDKDILMRVVAREVNLDETPVSKVMTRNPVFVLSDTLAVEALQKMVQGKFRHLPVVENGEVIALLDIAKCLYDAIARMERAAEKGKAIAAAVEGVEKHWGSSASGPSFIDTLRERLFKPSLSTIITENSKIVTVLPSDTVLVTAKKMLESRASCAIVTVENKPRGILTSKDILMRLIAQGLPADSTLVEKVMTPNPGCATVDTPIVDALHQMHDGKYLHLPVVDRDGVAVAVVDVFHITHAAVATVGSTAGINTETANTMMQNFWDSAMALSADEEDETPSENSMRMTSEGGETGPFPSSTLPNTFAFKIEDRRGRIHRFTCDTRSLTDLITALLQRVGGDIDHNKHPQILYEDEDHDKVILASDSDLVAAVEHAKAAGWKGLRLFLENSATPGRRRASGSESVDYEHADAWASAYKAVAAGAALVAGLSILAYLMRSNN